MSGLNRDPPKSGEYYVEPTNPYRLAITKLGHLAAHIRCLRIIQDRCVRKMNDRYRALRSKEELPIAILAWLKDSGANADIRDDTFTNAVHLLRLRDRALRRGNTEKATTGSSDLDDLQIKKY
jgi:hypothetical protein